MKIRIALFLMAGCVLCAAVPVFAQAGADPFTRLGVGLSNGWIGFGQLAAIPMTIGFGGYALHHKDDHVRMASGVIIAALSLLFMVQPQIVVNWLKAL